MHIVNHGQGIDPRNVIGEKLGFCSITLEYKNAWAQNFHSLVFDRHMCRAFSCAESFVDRFFKTL